MKNEPGRGIDLLSAIKNSCLRYVLDHKGKRYGGSVAKIGFHYYVQFIRPDGTLQAEWSLDNLMPTAAIQKVLSSSMDGGAQVSSFYLGAYTNNRTPLATDVSTDLPEYGEITTFSEGSRQLWNKGALQGTMYDSASNPTVLTATEQVTVAGVFMSTQAAFGSTAGILWSAVLGPSPEVIKAGSTLRIPASILLVNA